MDQVDLWGRRIPPLPPPGPNVTTDYIDWGYEENDDGKHIIVERVTHSNNWYCEYAKFEADGLCHGCDNEKERTGYCRCV